MNSLLHSLTSVWSDPVRSHAILVHFPVVAGTLGLVFVVALMLTGGRSPGMRWASVILYTLGAAAGYFAMLTGRSAGSEASTSLSAAAQELLEKHEELGEKAWIFLLVTAVCCAFTAFRLVSVRTTMTVMAVLAALVTAGWITVTGHYGGELVYGHGVGVARHASPEVQTTSAATAPSAKGSIAPATSPSPALKQATPQGSATQPAAPTSTGKRKGGHDEKSHDEKAHPAAATAPADEPPSAFPEPTQPPAGDLPTAR